MSAVAQFVQQNAIENTHAERPRPIPRCTRCDNAIYVRSFPLNISAESTKRALIQPRSSKR